MNPTLVAVARGGGKPTGDRSCPLCAPVAGRGFTRPILETVRLAELGELPVVRERLWSDREQARSCAKEHWSLAMCLDCGHVFNDSVGVDSPRRPRWVGESGVDARLARRLLLTWVLEGALVADASADDDRFLERIMAAPGSQGLGFGSDGYESQHPAIELRSERMGAASELLPIDLLLVRHLLRYAADPAAELAAAYSVVADPHHCLLYLEEQAAEATLHTSLWQIDTAARHFFSAQSLRWMLNQLGFTSPPTDGLRRPAPALLSVDARYTGQGSDPWRPEPMAEANVNAVAAALVAQRDHWATWLARRQATNRRVVVWGLDEVGVTFCNAFDGLRAITAVVDPTGAYGGLFQAGTGLPIIGPQQLRVDVPDDVIVANSGDVNVIGPTLQGLGLTANGVLLC